MSDAKVTQAELARRAGVSSSAIQQILNGSVKRSRHLPEIAAALDVSSGWLEGRTGLRSVETVVDYAAGEPNDTTLVSYVRIEPRGNGSNMEESKISAVRITSSWLERIAGTSNFAAVVFVHVGTNEMSPTIVPGDEACIRLTAEFDGTVNGIWLSEFRGQKLLRRYREISDELLLATSDNPSIPAVELPTKEVTFQGKVVWQGRSLEA